MEPRIKMNENGVLIGGMSYDEYRWRGMDPRTDYNRVAMFKERCRVDTVDPRLSGKGCGRPAEFQFLAFLLCEEMRARYPGHTELMQATFGPACREYVTLYGNFYLYAAFYTCRGCYQDIYRTVLSIGRADKMTDSFLIEKVMGPRHGLPYIGPPRKRHSAAPVEVELVRAPSGTGAILSSTGTDYLVPPQRPKDTSPLATR